MELLKTIVCWALIFIVVSDVIVARPKNHLNHTELRALVKDIDNQLIKKHAHDRRRRRRHILSRSMALMEYCLTNPRRCQHELRRLQNQNNNHQFRVVVIEK